MKFAIFLLAVLIAEGVYAWGGRFNRFSPEMLSNLGYGGYARHGVQRFLPASSTDLLESLLQSEEDEEINEPSGVSSGCSGRRCSANEHCCPGTVCVDLDGPSMGTCLPHHGQRQGSTCHRNTDCDIGLVCAVSEAAKICQLPTDNKKQYNEECNLSSECDITRGLCCQLLRRHRQSPRKACSYFRDPMLCLGPVAVDLVKEQVQHTANEKRLTERTLSGGRD